MPEENQSPSPSISPTLEKHKRNWKKILPLLLIGLFLISLVGVGIYFYGSSDNSFLFKRDETKEPSNTSKEHPLKNKIIYTKSIITDEKYNTSPNVELSKVDTDIYAMNLDGSGETKIVDLEVRTNLNYPTSISLSPNNTYLVWIRENADGEEKLNYVELAIYGQNTIKTLISDDGIKGFKFSPDETKI
ncbi:MAG: hypothetical protein QQN41_13670, partial [Nitrosopumilus sp.]